jgi:outer membrane protease
MLETRREICMYETQRTDIYKDFTYEDDKDVTLTASGIYVNGSLGLGYHFTPMISFFVKGGFCMKLGDPTWKVEDDEIDLTNEKNYSKDFKTIKGISIPVFAGLRFRF